MESHFPDAGVSDDQEQVDDLGGGLMSQRLPADDDCSANDLFGGGGEDTWETPEKQEESSFSTSPTKAPNTARTADDNFQNSSLGNSTDDWGKSDWPKRIGKPEHQAQWEANTHENLNHAKMLIQKAQAHQSDNDRHVVASGKRGKNQSGAVTKMIKKKMVITNDLIKALEDRHESVEDTIRQVGECLFQLQRAHRSKWAPLNVCECRLELRDTRPIQELVRDHTQEALEHERQTLIESRQELLEQIASSKDCLLALDKLKIEVVEDLSQKRYGLRIDRTCLNPGVKPKGQERTVLPQLGEVSNYSLPASPKDSDRGSHHEESQNPKTDTQSLIHKAVRMEEDAMKLCNESDACMLQTKRECQRAATQALSSLARRAEETGNLKRKLEAQMREIDEVIKETELSLGKTKKKLEHQEGPLRALDTQMGMRGKQQPNDGTEQPRPCRQNTVLADPVFNEMESHLEVVKKNVKALTQKFQNTETLLGHLQESRKQLTEDYRNKLLSLKIEDACLKVTPRKAMELDRTDPRGGRCKAAPAKRAPKKEGVYSLDNSMQFDGNSQFSTTSAPWPQPPQDPKTSPSFRQKCVEDVRLTS